MTSDSAIEKKNHVHEKPFLSLRPSEISISRVPLRRAYTFLGQRVVGNAIHRTAHMTRTSFNKEFRQTRTDSTTHHQNAVSKRPFAQNTWFLDIRPAQNTQFMDVDDLTTWRTESSIAFGTLLLSHFRSRHLVCSGLQPSRMSFQPTQMAKSKTIMPHCPISDGQTKRHDRQEKPNRQDMTERTRREDRTNQRSRTDMTNRTDGRTGRGHTGPVLKPNQNKKVATSMAAGSSHRREQQMKATTTMTTNTTALTTRAAASVSSNRQQTRLAIHVGIHATVMRIKQKHSRSRHRSKFICLFEKNIAKTTRSNRNQMCANEDR